MTENGIMCLGTVLVIAAGLLVGSLFCRALFLLYSLAAQNVY